MKILNAMPRCIIMPYNQSDLHQIWSNLGCDIYMLGCSYTICVTRRMYRGAEAEVSPNFVKQNWLSNLQDKMLAINVSAHHVYVHLRGSWLNFHVISFVSVPAQTKYCAHSISWATCGREGTIDQKLKAKSWQTHMSSCCLWWQKRDLRPKHDLFLTLIKWCLNEF